VRVRARREVHADAVRAPHVDTRVRHFEQQARTVFDRAAVEVGALVRAVLQELVEQIAVRAVHFDAVEARAFGVFRALPVSRDDAGDFVEIERTRRDVGALRTHEAHVAGRRDRARRDRQFAVEENRVRHTADVPQLQEDLAARVMHGFRHELPAFDLLVRPDARGIRVADALRRDRGRFAQDEAGGRAVGVVLRHQRVRHAFAARALTRKRSHDDAVAQREGADFEWVEKS
jgi:hypothetical protein